MTFNKLKDVPEAKKETSTQSVPWWATYTKTPGRRSTVSPAVTNTAAYTAAYEESDKLREDESDEDDDEDDKVVFNTVRFQPVPGLEERVSQNKRRPGADTVGKLINVTGCYYLRYDQNINRTMDNIFAEGSVPTKMMHGLIVPVKSSGKSVIRQQMTSTSLKF